MDGKFVSGREQLILIVSNFTPHALVRVPRTTFVELHLTNECN